MRNHKLSSKVTGRFGFMVASILVLTPLSIGLLSACTSSGKPAATSKLGHEELEGKIKAALSADEQLRPTTFAVKANADRNEATLAGTVDSESAKSQAIETAKKAQSGLTVISNIDISAKCCGAAHGRHMPEMNGNPGHEHMPHVNDQPAQ